MTTAPMGRPPPKPFGQGDDIGVQVKMLTGQELAGAAHAGLHLIDDEQNVFSLQNAATLAT